MEIKDWLYEDFPEFTDNVDGVSVLPSDGKEIGVHYCPNIKYASVNGTDLHLQILRPFNRQNGETEILPCIVFVQGSAWMKQNVYGQLPLMGNLARRGYVIACVEYRHSEIAPFPAQAIDTRNAVRFLKKNAQTYGIDPEKIILGGDSSGGHTAMFAGILHNDDSDENLFPGISGEVKGIINLYGSVSVMYEDGNPTTLNHHLPDSPEGLEMGGINLKEHPELCRKLSAECNIFPDTEIAPVLIFHGTKDRTVHTKQSVGLYKRLKECGKDVQLYLIAGGDHGGAEYWTEQILDIEEKFIKKCLS